MGKELLRLLDLGINSVSFFIVIFCNDMLNSQEINHNIRREIFMEQGIQYYKSNKYKQAMDSFMQVLLITPNDKKAKKYLKKSAKKYEMLIKEKILKERKHILDKAKKQLKEEEKKKDFSRLKNLYLTAKDEYKKGNYLRAFSKFKEINKIKRNYKDTEYYMSVITKEMSEISKLETYSDIKMLFYAKGFMFYNNEEYVNAINEWEKFLNIEPENKEVREYFENTKSLLKDLIETERIKRLKLVLEELNKRAEEYFKLKKYQSSINLWKKMIEICEHEKTDSFKEISELAKNNIELVLSEIKKIIKKENNNENKPEEIFVDEKLAEKHYTQGLVFYSSGQLNDAIREWEISLRYNPNYEKAKKAKEKVEKEIESQK